MSLNCCVYFFHLGQSLFQITYMLRETYIVGCSSEIGQPGTGSILLGLAKALSLLNAALSLQPVVRSLLFLQGQVN